MKKTSKWVVGIVVLVAVIVLASSSMFIVEEGEYKVVLQFGEAVYVHETPGLKFKLPFVQTTYSLPKYQMIYDSYATPILTRDQKPIEVDNYTVWRIDDVHKFLRTAQTVARGEQRIDNAVYNAVRRKLSETEYGDIISETGDRRGDLNRQITEEVQETLRRDNYGIEVIDVRIRRTDLPEENKASVFNRMISDRKAIAARYLSEGDEEARIITSEADRQAVEIIAQAEAEAKRIIAEGEEEAARIYNEAFGADPEFYNLYRTLESYKTSFQGETVIMLPIDSPYARILLGLD
jgi:membrane protease subunit HflC